MFSVCQLFTLIWVCHKTLVLKTANNAKLKTIDPLLSLWSSGFSTNTNQSQIQDQEGGAGANLASQGQKLVPYSVIIE